MKDLPTNLSSLEPREPTAKQPLPRFLFELFTHLGYECGLISTVEYRIKNEKYQSTHTTPDPISLHKLLKKMHDSGCTHVFMEVSSHSIHQQRIAGIQFDGGIFSNITHDHLRLSWHF
jgi:UDP-N-acetylmuramoyl-L-alanyl-D-glutamate--2,6-diaminopimelate ligase